MFVCQAFLRNQMESTNTQVIIYLVVLVGSVCDQFRAIGEELH